MPLIISQPINSHPNQIAMNDEYGAMDDTGLTYTYNGEFKLEYGDTLLNPQVRYNVYGKMNDEKTNIMVVCHALTGNSALHTWWSELLGPGLLFDTDKFLVICANILGSCYGTTGPTSINPATGKRYGMLSHSCYIYTYILIALLFFCASTISSSS